MEPSMFDFEEKYRARGYTAVCGCDEAGAGPLAGPVYAAAVILPPFPVLQPVAGRHPIVPGSL